MPVAKRPEPHPKLVEVFEAPQESEALVIQGLLASAGIESLITTTDSPLPPDVIPGLGGVVVRVEPEVAEEAKRVISEYHDSPEIVTDDSVEGK